jgi:hypothetical protein
MTKWYNLADIHRDKHMRDAMSSYRARIARTHAMHARHIDIPQPGGSGRPTRITLLTQEGVSALYDPAETLPKLKPYPVPMRLTDKARACILEGGAETTFSTGGLEKTARVMNREQFIEFLVSIKNEELIEPDFIPL